MLPMPAQLLRASVPPRLVAGDLPDRIGEIPAIPATLPVAPRPPRRRRPADDGTDAPANHPRHPPADGHLIDEYAA